MVEPGFRKLSKGLSALPYSPDESEQASKLFRENYAELSKLAHHLRRDAGFSSTMETSDILHECFMKVSDKTTFTSDLHFKRTVVLAIRQVIVDHVRRRMANKRGNGAAMVEIEDMRETLVDFKETPEQVLVINDLLDKLEKTNPRWRQVVDARYFVGLSEKETATLIGISERTTRRDWNEARGWLASVLRPKS